MSKVLVTGGAGYIGSHTIIELLSKGYEVVAVDNFSNSHRSAFGRIRQITGKNFTDYEIDLLDAKKLDKVFKAHKIDAVIHFAAFKAVGESVEKPLQYYSNNLVSTLNLCKAMLAHGVSTLVFSSSCTVYGSPEKVPVDESAPVSATNPYGWTKLMSEQILKDISTAEADFQVISLRYFNPIGAHQSGLIGEAPKGIPNNLLPYVAQVASGKHDKLKIFGGDYDTPDGTGIRDYIHVTDLALGHIAALENSARLGKWAPINLGTGKGSSVLEVVRAFEKASGQKVPYEIVERRPGDIAEVYADPAKANSLLGWRAQKTLEQACRDTWNWQTKNPDGYTN